MGFGDFHGNAVEMTTAQRLADRSGNDWLRYFDEPPPAAPQLPGNRVTQKGPR